MIKIFGEFLQFLSEKKIENLKMFAFLFYKYDILKYLLRKVWKVEALTVKIEILVFSFKRKIENVFLRNFLKILGYLEECALPESKP